MPITPLNNADQDRTLWVFIIFPSAANIIMRLCKFAENCQAIIDLKVNPEWRDDVERVVRQIYSLVDSQL